LINYPLQLYIHDIAVIWLSLLLFAFVLWFLLVNMSLCDSILAHFQTVIIVCWDG